MNRGSKQTVLISSDGHYELRMNKMYLIIGVICALIGLISLLIPVLANEYSSQIFTASGILFLFFVGGGIYCILWYRNHRLFFSEQGFTTESAYGEKQNMKWDDISQVSFNSFAGMVRVVDKQGNIAKAHQHLVGFSSFIKTLLAQKGKYHFATESLPLKALGLE
jgi:glucan phosphoethanolaminetransferase (alkaline phosphatase superfamily)